jgi:hypothetical protein
MIEALILAGSLALVQTSDDCSPRVEKRCCDLVVASA